MIRVCILAVTASIGLGAVELLSGHGCRYKRSMRGVRDLLLLETAPEGASGGLLYVAELHSKSTWSKMDHLVCFLPGQHLQRRAALTKSGESEGGMCPCCMFASAGSGSDARPQCCSSGSTGALCGVLPGQAAAAVGIQLKS